MKDLQWQNLDLEYYDRTQKPGDSKINWWKTDFALSVNLMKLRMNATFVNSV